MDRLDYSGECCPQLLGKFQTWRDSLRLDPDDHRLRLDIQPPGRLPHLLEGDLVEGEGLKRFSPNILRPEAVDASRLSPGADGIDDDGPVGLVEDRQKIEPRRPPVHQLDPGGQLHLLKPPDDVNSDPLISHQQVAQAEDDGLLYPFIALNRP